MILMGRFLFSFFVAFVMLVLSETGVIYAQYATPTPTPTPPGGSTIDGTVYVDDNGNQAQDPGENGYQGATVSIPGVGATITDPLGKYSFANLTVGSYDVTLTVPAEYSLPTPPPNPNTTFVPPDAIVNFALSAAPWCESITAVSSTIPSGGSTSVSVVNCAPISPTPIYTWPTPAISGTPTPPPSDCGSIIGSGSTVTYNAPSTVCTDVVCTVSSIVSNPDGSNTYSTNINVTPQNTLSGAILIDSGGNNCASGTTPYAAGAVATVYNSGGSPTGSDVANSLGEYSLDDTTVCGDKTAVLSSVPGYKLRSARFDGGAWSSSNISSYTYGPFDFSGDHTLDFCTTDVFQWFQTTTGDVRMSALVDRIPIGKYAAAHATYPSVFYSSSFASDFGAGEASVVGWKVDDEYSYQEDAKNRNGSASYSFFVSRANQKGTNLQNIPGCAGPGACTIAISNLPTGAYINQGDLTITSYSHAAASHVLILVNGNVTIQSNILVPAAADNLLIIGAKGNLTIDESVGTTTLSSTTPHIEGIFTAEGSVTAQGDGCPETTPDRRLNVGGSLIANSLKPFAVGGSGSFVNNRSLCIANDKIYPSVYVDLRYDFVTQLTDFYKTSNVRWREVEP